MHNLQYLVAICKCSFILFFISSKLNFSGLFDLTKRKVIKNAEYLYPDVGFRANLMGRIKNNFKVLSNAVEDTFQRTIGEF